MATAQTSERVSVRTRGRVPFVGFLLAMRGRSNDNFGYLLIREHRETHIRVPQEKTVNEIRSTHRANTRRTGGLPAVSLHLSQP